MEKGDSPPFHFRTSGNGEAEVTQEWSIVHLSFPVILPFCVTCFVAVIFRARTAEPGQAQA